MGSGLSANIFLDVLILLMSVRDDETLTLIDQLIDTYTEELRLNNSLNSVLTIRFLSLLQEMKKFPRGEEGDVARISAIANFIEANKDVDEEDHLFFEAMKNLFETAKAAKSDIETINKKKRKIKNVLNFTKFKRWTTRMYGKLNEFLTTNDLDNQGVLLADVTNLARKVVDAIKGDLSAFGTTAEERVVFSDRESLRVALEKAQKSEQYDYVLRTDLQGLNEMLGRDGFIRGEFCVIYGLSHHFKTGLLLSIARGVASQNDPTHMVKPGKKPLILLDTLENWANKNTLWLFRTAYACTLGKPAAKDMPIDEMVTAIQDFYTSRGWEFIIEMYKGKDFGYDEYERQIEKYEALGYEIVLCMVDYMEKMKKRSSLYNGDVDSHQALAALTQGMFDFNKAKNITFITPHQFNRVMQQVADRVKTNVVKHFSTDGVSGSIAINQIVDLEIYIYIEKDLDQKPWLTVKRGKHRYVEDTPERKKYFAYPFDEKLGIVSDLGKKKGYVRDIYAAGSDAKKEAAAEKSMAEYESVLNADSF